MAAHGQTCCVGSLLPFFVQSSGRRSEHGSALGSPGHFVFAFREESWVWVLMRVGRKIGGGLAVSRLIISYTCP